MDARRRARRESVDASSARPRSVPRFGRMLQTVVVSLAGLAGVLGLAWLVLAPVLGLSIVVFKTGSMSPTIPEGGAAIVRLVDASELAVGDIVTVHREGSALPVTHRIQGIDAVAGQPADRSLVLKGDANKQPDMLPYQVAEARVVLVALPGAGTALALARSPLMIGGASLFVAALVFWTFWPGSAPSEPRRPEPAGTELRPRRGRRRAEARHG